METMNKDEIDVIKTSDFTLASTLLCLGFDIIGIDKTDIKRVIFYYRKTSDLEMAMQKFVNNEVRVNPKDFVFAQREVKTIIYSDIQI
jgi:hypothetical protein